MEKEKKIINCHRIDVMDDLLEFIQTPIKETPEGYLTVDRTIVTNVGVFTYKQKDGSLIRELRTPEEVFSSDSLNTLKLKPVTNGHPKKLVTTDNVKDFQVGTLGSDIFVDGYHVSIPLTITDSNTIQDIKSGKRALSCGYVADIEFSSGNWMGIEYDAIQRNIRYNHTAIVDKGRAGDAAILRMDDAGILIDSCEKDDKNKNNVKGDNCMSTNFKTIKLDDVDYQAEAEVIKKYNLAKKDNETLSKEIEKLKADNSKLQAEKDNFKEKLDVSEAKIKELEETKLDEKAIKAAVDARLNLVQIAKKADVEVKDEMDDLEIKKAVILKVMPKAVLDEKDQIYIDARFDGAIELLQEKEDEKGQEEKIIAENNQKVKGDIVKKDKIPETVSYKERRDQYIQNLKNEYKGGNE